MTDTNDARLSYFVATATQHLGDDLVGVALTDSLLGKPIIPREVWHNSIWLFARDKRP